MTPRIFVSHSSDDLDVVKCVVNLLEAAFVAKSGDIRCTSLPGYRLSAGDKTSEVVRVEISQANALLAIITRKSFASAWVLFEMGARWGSGERIVPLLGPGADPSVLRGPVHEINALSCSHREDLEQVLHDLAGFSKLEQRPRSRYGVELQAVLGLRDRLAGPENKARLLEVFRRHPDHYYQPGAVGAEVGLELEIVRELANQLVAEGYLDWELKQFGRNYRLSARERAKSAPEPHK